MNVPEKVLRRRDRAAAYLQDTYGIGTKNSLAQYASRGDGPAMRYIGRIPVYAIEDLDRWALSKLSEPVCKTRRRKAALKAEAAE
jgi:hypothetical protein